MTTAFLTSTAVMGVVVLAVVAWMVRSRGWYHYSPSVTAGGWSAGVDRGSRLERLDRLSERPAVWAVAFVVLVLGFVGGIVAFISGSVETSAMAGAAIAAGAGLLLLAYLLFGVYLAATQRGHPRSLAVAESAVVAGALFLVAIVARLMM